MGPACEDPFDGEEGLEAPFSANVVPSSPFHTTRPTVAVSVCPLFLVTVTTWPSARFAPRNPQSPLRSFVKVVMVVTKLVPCLEIEGRAVPRVLIQWPADTTFDDASQKWPECCVSDLGDVIHGGEPLQPRRFNPDSGRVGKSQLSHHLQLKLLLGYAHRLELHHRVELVTLKVRVRLVS